MPALLDSQRRRRRGSPDYHLNAIRGLIKGDMKILFDSANKLLNLHRPLDRLAVNWQLNGMGRSFRSTLKPVSHLGFDTRSRGLIGVDWGNKVYTLMAHILCQNSANWNQSWHILASQFTSLRLCVCVADTKANLSIKGDIIEVLLARGRGEGEEWIEEGCLDVKEWREFNDGLRNGCGAMHRIVAHLKKPGVLGEAMFNPDHGFHHSLFAAALWSVVTHLQHY
jgi:hypothetical protein